MKCYVAVTGVVFGLIVILHIWRATVERHMATDPWFILLTALAAALCFWAMRLLWRWPKR